MDALSWDESSLGGVTRYFNDLRICVGVLRDVTVPYTEVLDRSPLQSATFRCEAVQRSMEGCLDKSELCKPIKLDRLEHLF
jgi:hypothetical protein